MINIVDVGFNDLTLTNVRLSNLILRNIGNVRSDNFVSTDTYTIASMEDLLFVLSYSGFIVYSDYQRPHTFSTVRFLILLSEVTAVREYNFISHVRYVITSRLVLISFLFYSLQPNPDDYSRLSWKFQGFTLSRRN